MDIEDYIVPIHTADADPGGMINAFIRNTAKELLLLRDQDLHPSDFDYLRDRILFRFGKVIAENTIASSLVGSGRVTCLPRKEEQ